ncbi:unnamed protein product [Lathyrus sativus]|nr:unnamed protein product [Lathyrus sativus]
MYDESCVHVVMFPSAGMGHLTPFLRLASLLLNNHCKLTLITPLPTVSHAESHLLSHFHSSFPQLNLLPFHLPPLSSPPPTSVDPFFHRVQTLCHSTHLLPPLISSLSPPISIFISDIFLVTPLVSITQKLSLPNYTLFTSSAAMLSFLSHFPTIAHSKSDDDDAPEISFPVPGLPFSPLPYSYIPPILFQPTAIFRNQIIEDSPNLSKLHGIFVNTFVVFGFEILVQGNYRDESRTRSLSLRRFAVLPKYAKQSIYDDASRIKQPVQNYDYQLHTDKSL